MFYDRGRRSLERKRIFSIRSPPIPKLNVLKGTKYFSQTLEYLDKQAINESAHSASYQNFGVAVVCKEEMLAMKLNPFCNKSSI